ncbi:MAG: hypothetical protein FJY85_03000 [Deltaproteobacteria bacterium]|nr:hypothetical protein [Deltaproteobacteria bacterium]
MPEKKKRPTIYVRVTDRAGNEYLCPLDALRDPKDVTEEELRQCLDSARGGFSDEEAMAIIRSEFRKGLKDSE